MKIVFFMAVLFSSLTSFAQDFLSDDYHIIDTTSKCSREACFVIDGDEIGLVEKVDQEGFSYFDLNNKSSLSDMNISRGCYRGDIEEVKQIINALAGNTNYSYSNGGHTLIKDIKYREDNNKLFMDFLIQSDYSTEDIVYNEEISRCDK